MSALVSVPVVLLLQWTLLLALGWGAHLLCRHWHPRWRLMLWRSVLVLGVLLPVFRLIPLPRVNVVLPRIFLPAVAVAGGEAPGKISERERSAQLATTQTPIFEASVVTTPVLGARAIAPRPFRSVSWQALFFVGWSAGCGWELIRLVRLQRQLRSIVRRAAPASAPMQSLAQRIQYELGVSRDVRVRVSDATASPFLSGVIRPVILLPRALSEEFSPGQIEALLSHELAHQSGRDLVWCVAWRLMRAVCWFHPLVWKVPEAHTLACEEEADRIAAARVNDRENYAQLLAQMTLGVLRLRPVETELVLNATSHIARRLLQLGREQATAWRWKHSAASLAGVAGLLVLTAGWQFAQSSAAEKPAAPIETATVRVTVHDEAGKPVAGATITPTSLRSGKDRLRGASYGWVPERHGPTVKAITDASGDAQVIYPVAIVPTEEILTGEISFTVEHTGFAKLWVRDYVVSGPPKPVQMKRGIPLRVAAFHGANRERVSGLVPVLLGEPVPLRPDEWLRESDQSLTTRRMSAGKHFLHVSGRLPSGEIGYSDGVAFFGEQRDAHDYVLEMKPGVRVEGRLDAKVARPIRNGWVQLSVHSDEANTRQSPVPMPRSFGNTGFWWSYRPIATDGNFVFESVPEGELKVIAYGDGFVSTNGAEEERPLPTGARISPQPARRPTRSVPQAFFTVHPATSIEVLTEATATLKVIARTEGKPVAGANVHVWPNVIQMPSGSRLFGAGGDSSEASFRTLPRLPVPSYSVTTDSRGEAVLRNVPAFTPSLGVIDSRFEVPMQSSNDTSAPERFRWVPDRYIELNLAAGQTTEVEIALQPKGREFIGRAP